LAMYCDDSHDSLGGQGARSRYLCRGSSFSSPFLIQIYRMTD
jgi:hypothetical protein